MYGLAPETRVGIAFFPSADLHRYTTDRISSACCITSWATCVSNPATHFSPREEQLWMRKASRHILSLCLAWSHPARRCWRLITICTSPTALTLQTWIFLVLRL